MEERLCSARALGSVDTHVTSKCLECPTLPDADTVESRHPISLHLPPYLDRGLSGLRLTKKKPALSGPTMSTSGTSALVWADVSKVGLATCSWWGMDLVSGSCKVLAGSFTARSSAEAVFSEAGAFSVLDGPSWRGMAILTLPVTFSLPL